MRNQTASWMLRYGPGAVSIAWTTWVGLLLDPGSDGDGGTAVWGVRVFG